MDPLPHNTTAEGAPKGEPQTLADGLQAEIDRCQELLAEYRAIPTGAFGALIIQEVLRRATAAILSGDVVAMLRVYEELKGLE